MKGTTTSLTCLMASYKYWKFRSRCSEQVLRGSYQHSTCGSECSVYHNRVIQLLMLLRSSLVQILVSIKLKIFFQSLLQTCMEYGSSRSTVQLRLLLKYILAVNTRCLRVQASEKCEISTSQTTHAVYVVCSRAQANGKIRDVALQVVILGTHSHTPHTASVRLAQPTAPCLTSLKKQFSQTSIAKRFNYLAVVFFSGMRERDIRHEAILAHTTMSSSCTVNYVHLLVLAIWLAIQTQNTTVEPLSYYI